MAEYQFSLKQRESVAEGTMAFWFDTTSAPDFSFEAGQNADYTLIDPPETDAEGNMRTFSFAQSPHHAGEIMIATRMRDTAFKRVLKTMPIGTPVKVVAPLGNMVLHDDQLKPAILLAGGIGITPFRSMIELATHKKLPHQIHLLYSNRDQASTPFHQDLLTWQSANSNFHYHPTLTDKQPADWSGDKGRIDFSLIRKYVPNTAGAVFYIAGPDAMTMAFRKMLLTAGISRDNIKLEAFSGY